MKMEQHSGWDGYDTWHLVLPPSRPDEVELSRVRVLASTLPRDRDVAVLGSTPEFRELLFDLDFEYRSCIDRSRSFYERMTGILGTAGSAVARNETLIQDDWRSALSDNHGRFSLILSDLTAGNIHFDDRADFYRAIADSLAPGGYFVDKNLTNEGHWYAPSEIDSYYSHRPVNLVTANHFSCRALFCSSLIREIGLVDTTALYNDLAILLPSPHMRAIIDLCRLVTPEGMHWYYGREWKEVQRTYCTDLTQIARFPQPSGSAYEGNAFQTIFQKDR